MSLNKLCDEALKIATSKGFKGATPGESIALMHSELSEALEEIRNGKSINEIYYDHKGLPSKPCGVPIELADELIRIFHFCGEHQIDLDTAVNVKMEYNRSRPYKHGGKTL